MPNGLIFSFFYLCFGCSRKGNVYNRFRSNSLFLDGIVP